MELNIKTEGLDDFLKKIWELTLKKTLNDSIKKSIIYTERVAKIKTPVDTWILRNSYETKFSDLKWELRNFRIYAPFVHDWHKQEVWRFVPAIWKRLKKWFVRGNPWMDDTLNQVEPEISQIFENDIQKMINSLID